MHFQTKKHILSKLSKGYKCETNHLLDIFFYSKDA